MSKVNNETDRKILLKIDIQIENGINHFVELNFERDKIKIYMPEYVNRMYCRYNGGVLATLEKLQGVAVCNGYENAIIISVKNNVIYSMEPIKIEL